jgi:hypothetical protein
MLGTGKIDLRGVKQLAATMAQAPETSTAGTPTAEAAE